MPQPEVIQTEPGRRWQARLDPWHATCFRGRLHDTHTWLEEPSDKDQKAPPEVLRELTAALAAASGVPVGTKAEPGADHHARMLAAGATAYQRCPASHVDPGAPANAAWAASPVPDGLELRDLTGRGEEQILDDFVRQYTWVHERWSPVRDEQTAREVLAPMLAEELDRERSVLVLRDGEPVAEAFAFTEPDGTVGVVVETLDRETTDGLSAVRAAMQDVLRRVDVPILFDGHVDDPHYPVVLGEIPEVTGRGLDLLQLGSSGH